MDALATAKKTLANYTPPASVLAGGGASILIFLVGCALVAGGVTLPLGIGPVTMTMVAAAAPLVGHFVTTLVPDTYNQQINALAKKVDASVEDLKEVVPQVAYTYPTDKNGQTIDAKKTPNNLG